MGRVFRVWLLEARILGQRDPTQSIYFIVRHNKSRITTQPHALASSFRIEFHPDENCLVSYLDTDTKLSKTNPTNTNTNTKDAPTTNNEPVTLEIEAWSSKQQKGLVVVSAPSARETCVGACVVKLNLSSPEMWCSLSDLLVVKIFGDVENYQAARRSIVFPHTTAMAPTTAPATTTSVGTPRPVLESIKGAPQTPTLESNPSSTTPSAANGDATNANNQSKEPEAKIVVQDSLGCHMVLSTNAAKRRWEACAGLNTWLECGSARMLQQLFAQPHVTPAQKLREIVWWGVPDSFRANLYAKGLETPLNASFETLAAAIASSPMPPTITSHLAERPLRDVLLPLLPRDFYLQFHPLPVPTPLSSETALQTLVRVLCTFSHHHLPPAEISAEVSLTPPANDDGIVENETSQTTTTMLFDTATFVPAPPHRRRMSSVDFSGGIATPHTATAIALHLVLIPSLHECTVAAVLERLFQRIHASPDTAASSMVDRSANVLFDALWALRTFDAFAWRRLPRVMSHLQRQNIPISLLSAHWIASLFASAVPATTCIRILDVVLFHENPRAVLIAVAVALLRCFTPMLHLALPSSTSSPALGGSPRASPFSRISTPTRASFSVLSKSPAGTPSAAAATTVAAMESMAITVPENPSTAIGRAMQVDRCSKLLQSLHSFHHAMFDSSLLLGLAREEYFALTSATHINLVAEFGAQPPSAQPPPPPTFSPPPPSSPTPSQSSPAPAASPCAPLPPVWTCGGQGLVADRLRHSGAGSILASFSRALVVRTLRAVAAHSAIPKTQNTQVVANANGAGTTAPFARKNEGGETSSSGAPTPPTVTADGSKFPKVAGSAPLLFDWGAFCAHFGPSAKQPAGSEVAWDGLSMNTVDCQCLFHYFDIHGKGRVHAHEMLCALAFVTGEDVAFVEDDCDHHTTANNNNDDIKDNTATSSHSSDDSPGRVHNDKPFAISSSIAHENSTTTLSVFEQRIALCFNALDTTRRGKISVDDAACMFGVLYRLTCGHLDVTMTEVLVRATAEAHGSGKVDCNTTLFSLEDVVVIAHHLPLMRLVCEQAQPLLA